jgi:hypothetical protein
MRPRTRAVIKERLNGCNAISAGRAAPAPLRTRRYSSGSGSVTTAGSSCLSPSPSSSSSSSSSSFESRGGIVPLRLMSAVGG